MNKATGEAADKSQATGEERRVWPRVPAERLARLAARLASGADVRLIDLSRGGARIETDRRMLPSSSVAIKLVAADAAFVVTGRVVRSRVIRLAGSGLGYDVAISFNEPLHQFVELPQPGTVAAPPEPVSAAAAPVPVAPSEGPHPIAGIVPDLEAEPAEPLDPNDSAWPVSMIHVTATLDQTSEELIDLFDVADW